MFELNTQVHM